MGRKVDAPRCVKCNALLDRGGCTNFDCRLYVPNEEDPSILDEAARIVNGDRQQSYGHPRDNHECTAELWNAYINRREIGYHKGFDAYDVCMLNILQKISRLANSRERDGLVDIAGFAANAEMVGE